ncbi:hypothetical protein [Streptomyces sp. SID13031]|uniref:hypothetical protein n=1 Tax=Streptomyces sp. SID13031 TaxID=2706046 RepID=UPI001940BE2B|nr:hypothetical protein [Streptomyces sp. SID13031]
MERIKGHYEWDNSGLTPGQKREGGLHQNLYDSDGVLKGSARFVPDDGKDTEPLVVTETVYVPIEQRRRTRQEQELEQAIADLVSHLIDRAIAKAKPLAEQWWRKTARPAIGAQIAKRRERRSHGKAQKSTTIEGIIEPAQELCQASEEDLPSMSSAEAQARYLAALAARAYSDEQMRLVTSARIVDGEGLAGLAELPADQVKGLLEAMATNPAMLGDATLAELASILGRRDHSGSDEFRQLHRASPALRVTRSGGRGNSG